MKRPGKSFVLRALLAVGAAAFAAVVYVYVTLPDVRVLATKNPTTTAFMELRQREAERQGRHLRHAHYWIPYSRISANLTRAVLVAEDSAFWQHEGIDVEQIRESIQVNIERGKAVRGASTITQQLAKNLYLSPSRDPFRKLRELIIARRLEAALPKARIFELYLNLIEWGDGVWGAEAAARTYFGISAASLSREQAALLAGAIINPRLMNPNRPVPRLLRRQRIILANMRSVEPPAPTLATVAPPPPTDTVDETPEVTLEGVEPGEEPTSEPPPPADVVPDESAPDPPV